MLSSVKALKRFNCEINGNILGPYEWSEIEYFIKNGDINTATRIQDCETGKWHGLSEFFTDSFAATDAVILSASKLGPFYSINRILSFLRLMKEKKFLSNTMIQNFELSDGLPLYKWTCYITQEKTSLV